MIWTPDAAQKRPTPLLVYLHSWSGDYRQDNAPWLQQAMQRDWIYLHPNFRGRNDHPQACGSRWARQDILDAIDFVVEKYRVDRSRIYLAGTSGGGHMAMLMAGYHPDRFSAVSAWVGISDLREWYRFHLKEGKPQKYAQMILASLGDAPGSSAAVDAKYHARSPLFHLHQVGDLPLDLNAGIRDGHTGSVPIAQTLNAFNVVAQENGFPAVSEQEIEQLWNRGKLSNPQQTDEITDEAYCRQFILQRHAGPARVTIFDGGHEGLPAAACHWLAQQTRGTITAGSRAGTNRPDTRQ